MTLSTDINRDPSPRPMDPDMDLDSSLDPDDILALGGRTTIQVGMVLAAMWAQDTTKASGCGPNPRPSDH